MSERSTGARPAPEKPITVLIADDHPMVRAGLHALLNNRCVVPVGEATNGSEAVQMAKELNPDVVLMDIRMPDMDGLEATQLIKQEVPAASVIIITSYESRDYLRRAIEAGASGYMLKGMPKDALLEGIKLVKSGGSLIDAKLLSELLQQMGLRDSLRRTEYGALSEALAPRERDILQLVVQGLTNKEIAREMHYSVGTVKNVVQRIIEKMGASDRTQAAVLAVRAGLDSR